jgi:hypothetical protein
VKERFVFWLTSVIDAPGITPPVASVMVPVIAPWSICEKAGWVPAMQTAKGGAERDAA